MRLPRFCAKCKVQSVKLKTAFTLIELLVVITIISVLLAIGTASYSSAQRKGRDSKRKSDLKSIQQALELDYQKFGKYPPSDGNPLVGGSDWLGYCARFQERDEIRNALSPSFIEKIPKDPKTPDVFGDYTYLKISNNQYALSAILENPNDPDISTVTQSFGCPAATYNYEVKSP